MDWIVVVVFIAFVAVLVYSSFDAIKRVKIV